MRPGTGSCRGAVIAGGSAAGLGLYVATGRVGIDNGGITTSCSSGLCIGGNGFSGSGIYSTGSGSGGYFDGGGLGIYTKGSNYGVSAKGGIGGVYGVNTNGNNEATLGYWTAGVKANGDNGVEAYGATYGVKAESGNVGIYAKGPNFAGYFDGKGYFTGNVEIGGNAVIGGKVSIGTAPYFNSKLTVKGDGAIAAFASSSSGPALYVESYQGLGTNGAASFAGKVQISGDLQVWNDAQDCVLTGFASEENFPNNWLTCPDVYTGEHRFVVGIQCEHDYCDNVRLKCCTL